MKKIKMKNEFQTFAKHWAIEPSAMQLVAATFKEVQSGLSLFAQKPLVNTYTTTIRDGVAVIPIHGIITPRADVFTFLMGGTALELLARDLQAAIDNPEVNAILLDIDSPGGVAVGPSEMADTIRKATQKKPIWAYVGRNCCSAAYWLASAANNIVAQKTALLGSIGVVSSVAVQEQPDADGYKQIEIVSSNAKNKRPDPRTPEGEATIRSELDALEAEFIQSVAMYRNVGTDTVKSDFGQGGVVVGEAAVNAGMADEIGDYETTIKKLSTKNNKGENSMDAKKAITKDQIAAYRAEGAKAERDRLLALDEVAVAGHEDLLAKAKADPNMTAEKLALQIVKAEKAKGGDYLNGLKKAANSMPQVTPSTKPVAKTNKGATPEERAKNEWNSNPDIRSEFNGDKDAFIAYCIARENGQIKIQTKGE